MTPRTRNSSRILFVVYLDRGFSGTVAPSQGLVGRIDWYTTHRSICVHVWVQRHIDQRDGMYACQVDRLLLVLRVCGLAGYSYNYKPQLHVCTMVCLVYVTTWHHTHQYYHTYFVFYCIRQQCTPHTNIFRSKRSVTYRRAHIINTPYAAHAYTTGRRTYGI